MALLIVGGMASVVVRHWPSIRSQAVHPHWSWVALSMAVLAVAFLVAAFSWSYLLRSIVSDVSQTEAVTTWMRSLTSKYLPGGVGLVLHRLVWFRSHAVAPETQVGMLVWEQGCPLLCAAFIGGLWSAFSGRMPRAWQIAVIGGCLLLVGAAVWFPNRVVRAVSWVRARLGYPAATAPLLSRGVVAWFVGLYMVYWVLVGAAFYGFVRAFHPVPVSALPSCVGAFALAFVIGYLALVVPGGVGVREGCLTAFLGQLMAVPLAVWVSLSSRLWIMAVEMICVAMAAWIGRRAPMTNGGTSRLSQGLGGGR